MKAFIYVTIILFAGCATSYQENGFTGGFNETQLSENMWQVSFSGNGFTGSKRVADFALLRAAEISEQNGFEYFGILSNEKDVSVQEYQTESRSTTTGSAQSFGNRYNYNEQTTTKGPETYYVSKPSNNITIRCFKDNPNGLSLYNVKIVKNSIKKKYGI